MFTFVLVAVLICFDYDFSKDVYIATINRKQLLRFVWFFVLVSVVYK